MCIVSGEHAADAVIADHGREATEGQGAEGSSDVGVGNETSAAGLANRLRNTSLTGLLR